MTNRRSAGAVTAHHGCIALLLLSVQAAVSTMRALLHSSNSCTPSLYLRFRLGRRVQAGEEAPVQPALDDGDSDCARQGEAESLCKPTGQQCELELFNPSRRK